MELKVRKKQVFKTFLTAFTLIVIALLLYGSNLQKGTVEIASEVVNQEEENMDDATIIDVLSSGVEIQKPGSDSWYKAESTEQITEGTKVRTDARGKAEITYPSGTLTSIDINTEITLKTVALEPQNIAVHITKGRIWSSIIKLLGGEAYQTESPTMVAAVRGTTYIHAVLANGQNQIVTTESKVEVGCVNNTGQKVAVGENKMVSSNCQTAPSVTQAPQEVLQDQWLRNNIEKEPERRAHVEEVLKERVEREKSEEEDKEAELKTLQEILSEMMTSNPEQEADQKLEKIELVETEPTDEPVEEDSGDPFTITEEIIDPQPPTDSSETTSPEDTPTPESEQTE